MFMFFSESKEVAPEDQKMNQSMFCFYRTILNKKNFQSVHYWYW